MKKILALVLAATMVFTLAACGGSAASSSAEAAPAAEAAEEAPAEEAAPAEAQKFIMGIDAEYPPFSYIGDDGEYTGFDVESVEQHARSLAGISKFSVLTGMRSLSSLMQVSVTVYGQV